MDLGVRLASGIKDVIIPRHGVEEVGTEGQTVQGKVIIETRELATEKATEASTIPGIICTDGSRLDTDFAGCSVAWRDTNRQWQSLRYHLRNRKEVFDAELYAIAEALKIANRRNIRNPDNVDKVIIYTDSTSALRRIQDPRPGPGQHRKLSDSILCRCKAWKGWKFCNTALPGGE
jgi:hypothetical protein